MSFLSVALSYIYISTIFYNILLCQSVQGYGYIWQVKGCKILCHFINTADKWYLIDGQQLWMWFGTFTHTCTAPQGMVVGNWHLQGRQPSPWGRSPVSSEQIGPDSVFRGSRVKWPSSLALLRMCLINGQWLWLWFGTFTHAWPAHQRIVLGTYHLQGRWSLVRGRSPVSFKQIGPGSVFRGIWAKGLSSPAPPDSCQWCTVGSSRCNLAHLLAPVLLLGGWW